MATKMPQRPKNLLQQIICDADLDYLGRNDFFILSEKLHKEFIEYKIACNDEEWKNQGLLFFNPILILQNRKMRDVTPAKRLTLIF